MLFDSKGNIVPVAKGQHLTDAMLRPLREKHETDHKGDRFFRLDQRAKFRVK